MRHLLLQPNDKGHPGGTASVKDILRFLTPAERKRLIHAAPEGEVVAYGKSSADATKWDRVSHDDPVLFYHNWKYFAEGKVALKTKSARLCRHLWGTHGKYEGRLHDRIILYSGLISTDILAHSLNTAIGYKSDYILRPFQAVAIHKPARVANVLAAGRRAATRIRGAYNRADPNSDLSEAREGRKQLAQHMKSERNRALTKSKLNSVLTATGRLACEACGFDAREEYPGLELNLADVHHLRPLAGGARKTHLTDLAVLCPNCHRMIHRTFPIMSIKAFRRHALNKKA